MGSLVTHIGSGFSGEVEASLDVLSDLVEADVAKMAPFTVFVKVSAVLHLKFFCQIVPVKTCLFSLLI